MHLADPQFNTLSVWLAAICTLGIFSLLYRENPVYRVFEYLFLGLGTAYGALRLFEDNLIPMWWDPIKNGQWWWMVPFLFGLLYFTIYFERFAWMARSLIGVLMGLVAGYEFVRAVREYFPQIRDSFQPLLPNSVVHGGAADWNTAGNNIVFFVTLIAVMTYFFFSFEHKTKFVAGTAKLGRWLLMISFGTMFGATITARVALAVSRLLFLLGQWLHVKL